MPRKPKSHYWQGHATPYHFARRVAINLLEPPLKKFYHIDPNTLERRHVKRWRKVSKVLSRIHKRARRKHHPHTAGEEYRKYVVESLRPELKGMGLYY